EGIDRGLFDAEETAFTLDAQHESRTGSLPIAAKRATGDRAGTQVKAECAAVRRVGGRSIVEGAGRERAPGRLRVKRVDLGAPSATAVAPEVAARPIEDDDQWWGFDDGGLCRQIRRESRTKPCRRSRRAEHVFFLLPFPF